MTEAGAIRAALKAKSGHDTRYYWRSESKWPGVSVFSGLCDSCQSIFFAITNQSYCSRQCAAIARIKRGVRVTKEGYVRTRGIMSRSVFQHRTVMEAKIGRPLLARENVHHKNGIRSDNRPENLELWVKPQPCGQRVKDLIAWVVDNYKEDVRMRIDVDDAVERVIADNTIRYVEID